MRAASCEHVRQAVHARGIHRLHRIVDHHEAERALRQGRARHEQAERQRVQLALAHHAEGGAGDAVHGHVQRHAALRGRALQRDVLQLHVALLPELSPDGLGADRRSAEPLGRACRPDASLNHFSAFFRCGDVCACAGVRGERWAASRAARRPAGARGPRAAASSACTSASQSVERGDAARPGRWSRCSASASGSVRRRPAVPRGPRRLSAVRADVEPHRGQRLDARRAATPASTPCASSARVEPRVRAGLRRRLGSSSVSSPASSRRATSCRARRRVPHTGQSSSPWRAWKLERLVQQLSPGARARPASVPRSAPRRRRPRAARGAASATCPRDGAWSAMRCAAVPTAIRRRRRSPLSSTAPSASSARFFAFQRVDASLRARIAGCRGEGLRGAAGRCPAASLVRSTRDSRAFRAFCSVFWMVIELAEPEHLRPARREIRTGLVEHGAQLGVGQARTMDCGRPVQPKLRVDPSRACPSVWNHGRRCPRARRPSAHCARDGGRGRAPSTAELGLDGARVRMMEAAPAVLPDLRAAVPAEVAAGEEQLQGFGEAGLAGAVAADDEGEAGAGREVQGRAAGRCRGSLRR